MIKLEPRNKKLIINLLSFLYQNKFNTGNQYIQFLPKSLKYEVEREYDFVFIYFDISEEKIIFQGDIYDPLSVEEGVYFEIEELFNFLK